MFLLGRLKLYAIGVVVFVLALLGIYWSGRRDGAAAVKADITEDRLDAMKTAKDVEDEIRSLDVDDPAFIDRASQWVRKDSGQ
jgi:hypothetical protein